MRQVRSKIRSSGHSARNSRKPGGTPSVARNIPCVSGLTKMSRSSLPRRSATRSFCFRTKRSASGIPKSSGRIAIQRLTPSKMNIATNTTVASPTRTSGSVPGFPDRRPIGDASTSCMVRRTRSSRIPPGARTSVPCSKAVARRPRSRLKPGAIAISKAWGMTWSLSSSTHACAATTT